MSPSPIPRDAVGTPASPSAKRSITPHLMEEPPTDYVIDLTLDSDDEISEAPHNESTDSTYFIKKEPGEPVALSDEISEFPREVEREPDEQVVQSIEEGPGASTIERVIPRVTPRAISEEAAVMEDGFPAGTVAQAGVPTNIPAAIIPPRPIATRPLSREELIARDQELENQLRNGIAEFHASLNINALVPAARETPQLTLVPEDEDTSWMLQAGEDEDAKEAEAAAEFSKHKKLYEQKKRREEATVEDDIEFAAAEAVEKRRLKRAKKIEVRMQQRVDRESPASTDDEEMFFPERPSTIKHPGRKLSPEDDDDDVDPEPRLVKKPKISQPKNKNKLTAQEMRDSMKGGLEAGLAKEKKKSGRKPRKPIEKAKKSSPKSKAVKNKDEAGKVTRKRGRRRKGPIFSNIASLTNSNIIKDAQANAAKRDMPTFSAKDKSKALQELISSIPIAERHMVSSDKQAILDATRKFNGRGVVKSDERGGWILKGMTSSLFNHQVLGAGFLRDRENGNSKPFGGMVCDEMGFGKTITMLASILDGKAEPDNPNKTTLIIATPSLVSQWMDEIEKHFQPGVFGKVIRYHSGAKLFSNDPLGDLKAYDIILTTYSEVRQSYPVYRPPMHLTTEATKNAWWAEHFRNTIGPLHNIRFRRIVCDEAQALKNHMSLTSIAVRALHGHYRWIISGTPIQNYIEELYAYFNFLKVPHTGDFTTFVNNYCESRIDRSLVNMERINNILRAIMLRRTHVDTLFNAPIVKLPGIEHDTVMLEFNEVERAIYKLIKSKFINVINNYSKTGSIETHYRNILAMMLKLRMLTGHILLVQQSLKELMVAADVEALWRLTAKEVEHSGDKPNTHSLLQLRQMFKEKAKARKKPVAGNLTPEPSPGAEEEGEEMTAGGSFGLTFKFRKFLRALKESKVWPELHSRSICSKCRMQPDDPYVTSCFHVYCKECLTAMSFESAQREEVQVSCLECGTFYGESSPCSGLQELGYNSPTTIAKVEKKRERKNSKASKKKLKDRKETGDSESDSEPEDVDWIELAAVPLPSAKTSATKACILNWLKKAPETKIIIYTQFLDMIRILQKMCTIEGWGFVTFTGKMSFPARDKSIKTFRDDPNTNIMLCSLKAGGVGLNLTMASKVIILDLWFNSSVEAQAYCRAFRIGQEKKVEVIRFVIKDSIDEDLIHMQERKDIEISAAMGPDTQKKRATITELLSLFGEVREDGNNEFILVEDEEVQEDSDVDMAEIVPPRPF